MNFTEWFVKNKLDNNDAWFQQNLLLETILGSHAYGCNREDSDYDIYCIVMPRREHLWPQKFGYILNFDDIPSFRRKELKGDNRTKIDNKEVEIEWISIIEFFNLAGLSGSPNLLEVLFAKRNLVTVSSKVGWMLRDKRKLFLSLKTFHSFKHYACRQMQKIRSREPVSTDRRKIIKQYGYDIKMSYHVLRLLDEMQQMLIDNDIDLMRNNSECRLMREGAWGDLNRFEQEFQKRMDYVEDLSRKTSLPQQLEAASLHNFLNELIEDYYGSEDKAQRNFEYISTKDVMDKLSEITEMLNDIKAP